MESNIYKFKKLAVDIFREPPFCPRNLSILWPRITEWSHEKSGAQVRHLGDAPGFISSVYTPCPENNQMPSLQILPVSVLLPASYILSYSQGWHAPGVLHLFSAWSQPQLFPVLHTVLSSCASGTVSPAPGQGDGTRCVSASHGEPHALCQSLSTWGEYSVLNEFTELTNTGVTWDFLLGHLSQSELMLKNHFIFLMLKIHLITWC